MANPKNRPVTLRVDKHYFDKVFEPARKRMQNRLGLSKFTQPQFTAYLAKSKMKIKYPKMKNIFKRGFKLDI